MCARRHQPRPHRPRRLWRTSDPKSGGVENGAKVQDHPQTHWKPNVTAGVEAEAAATLLRDFFRGEAIAVLVIPDAHRAIETRTKTGGCPWIPGLRLLRPE